MILEAVALGIAIGLSLGALGGGGSILTVPALVFVLGFTAQQATSGSLVIVGATASIASVGHARAGHTRWRKGFILALVGVPASILGSNLNRDVNPDVLLMAFAALMVAAAIGMLVHTQSAHPGQSTDDPPAAGTRAAGASPVGVVAEASSTLTLMTPMTSGTTNPATRRFPRVVLAGLGIGFLTGFLGVGGGFVIVPVLVVMLRCEMPVAVGTSLIVIALNSAVALAARLGEGGLVWRLVLPFTLAAIAGSVAGKRVTDSIDADNLTKAFAVLLLAVAGYVGIKAGMGTS